MAQITKNPHMLGLRSKAESLLTKTKQNLIKMSAKEIQELVYELQVHQIELKMQNEELINAQIELQQSRDKYSDLYDFAPIGYLTLNRDGIITEANLMAGKLLDHNRSTLINKKFTQFIAPKSQDIFYFHTKQVLHNKRPESCELKLKKENGNTFPVEFSSTIINGSDNLLVTINDITEREIAKQKIIKSRDEAKEASKAKSEFLANMSHEIRTPLNAIIGIGHILSRSTLTADMKRFVDTLRTSADSLLDLINELLDIAKIESTSLILENVTFNLENLISETVNMMRIKAEEKNLTIEMIGHLATSYYGDPSRLRQIIVNLLGNAIKFTEKGKITLQLHANPGENNMHNIIIMVTDTGIGIPKEKYKNIFQTFTQADTSTTRKYGGTGLGLSICKKLVELMDGSINVRSEEGVGSVFTVALQLQVSQEKPISLKMEEFVTVNENNTLKTPRILLVEDHGPNILIATTYLKSFNYQYDVANSGTEAINMYQANDYDLILMDVQMQDMDGFEATKKIRAIEAKTNAPPIPVIAMTAHAFAGDRERCCREGMDDYISKPFNPKELNEKIEYYLLKQVA